MGIKLKIEHHSNIILFGLLVLNFIIRLIIYFNTTLFDFNDWGTYLKTIEKINAGEKIQLFSGFASSLNSYLGYFFKYVLGNFDLYFIFNCLLGTLTIFIVYKIMRYLNTSIISGLLAVVFLTLYTEFTTFSSIFYTPIIMGFLLSITILFSLKYIKEVKHSILYAIILFFTISLSLLFKLELKYAWGIYLLLGFFYIKNNLKLGIKLVLVAIILLAATKTIENRVINKGFDDNIKQPIYFPGHTWYGGEGGKTSIIYPEKQDLYNENFRLYCERNNISNPSREDEINFQQEHVKDFIINHTFSWIQLQWHKFFWEYGVLPEANSFKVLMTGLTNKHTVLTAILVVFPITVYIILLIISFDIRRLLFVIKKRPEMQFMSILFLYYLFATVFYFAYSERYRIPVMVCFLIPLLAVNITDLRIKKLLKNKKELIIKGLIILVFLVNWSYEAYVIGVKNKERYFETIKATKEFIKDSIPLENFNH